MTETKYGDRVPDDAWEEDDDEAGDSPTSIKNHEIDVVLTTDPDADMGYGRERYTVTLTYDDDGDDPVVLYVVEHRWKGNYWRDTTDWDWRDIPEAVREQVADVLPVADAAALTPENRLIAEGGESRWKKHHKPRMDAMDSGEVWGQSSLKDASRVLQRAAEKLPDGSAEEAEALVDRVHELIEDVEPEVEEE